MNDSIYISNLKTLFWLGFCLGCFERVGFCLLSRRVLVYLGDGGWMAACRSPGIESETERAQAATQ